MLRLREALCNVEVGQISSDPVQDPGFKWHLVLYFEWSERILGNILGDINAQDALDTLPDHL